GNLYISDTDDQRVRRVSVTDGVIMTVAGDGRALGGGRGDGGRATSASLNFPEGLAVDGESLFIADIQNQRSPRVDLASGIITTVAGNGQAGYSGDGGPATSASLNGPNDVALDAAGNLYIADAQNHRVRRIDATGTIWTEAGNGLIGSSG